MQYALDLLLELRVRKRRLVDARDQLEAAVDQRLAHVRRNGAVPPRELVKSRLLFAFRKDEVEPGSLST